MNQYDLNMTWVPVGEAMRRLGVTKQRIHQLIREGKLVSAKVVGTVMVEEGSVARRRSVMDRLGMVKGGAR